MLVKHPLDRAELAERIERSCARLMGDYYQMPDVFRTTAPTGPATRRAAPFWPL